MSFIQWQPFNIFNFLEITFGILPSLTYVFALSFHLLPCVCVVLCRIIKIMGLYPFTMDIGQQRFHHMLVLYWLFICFIFTIKRYN